MHRGGVQKKSRPATVASFNRLDSVFCPLAQNRRFREYESAGMAMPHVGVCTLLPHQLLVWPDFCSDELLLVVSGTVGCETYSEDSK